jgi:hypothetical protein
MGDLMASPAMPQPVGVLDAPVPADEQIFRRGVVRNEAVSDFDEAAGY